MNCRQEPKQNGLEKNNAFYYFDLNAHKNIMKK